MGSRLECRSGAESNAAEAIHREVQSTGYTEKLTVDGPGLLILDVLIILSWSISVCLIGRIVYKDIQA